MKIKEIIQSLKRWETVIKNNSNNYALLKKYMDDASYFIFKQNFYSDSEFIHAYPGIVKNELKIFLIPGQLDRSNEIEAIEKVIEICDVIYESTSETQLSDPIHPNEAIKRIKCWKKNCRSWTPKQAKCETGFPKCFLIPMIDIKVNDGQPLKAFFALKQQDNINEFSGDLVIKKLVSHNFENAEEYYDTIKLVPPFSPNEETYLLDQTK